MLEMIHAPEWLITFWGIYGEVITPILMTLVTALTTALALKIRTDAKVNVAKADLQIEALKKINDKEDVNPTVEVLSEKIDELESNLAEANTTIMYLAEMFNLAFQKSELTEETKEELNGLLTKAKYGSNTELIKELEATSTELRNQVENLQAQLDAKEQIEPDHRNRRVRR